MKTVDGPTLSTFLATLGRRQEAAARLTLLGGCAMILLGRERTTFDIDYVGDDLVKTDFQRTIDEVAAELRVAADAVPIERFVPIPADSSSRDRFIGEFGPVTVFLLDPYVVALTKIDRGFDDDLEDVVFLVKGGLVDLDHLTALVVTTLERATEFDIDPAAMHRHLQIVRDGIAAC